MGAVLTKRIVRRHEGVDGWHPNHQSVVGVMACRLCSQRLYEAMDKLNRLDAERGPRWADKENTR